MMRTCHLKFAVFAALLATQEMNLTAAQMTTQSRIIAQSKSLLRAISGLPIISTIWSWVQQPDKTLPTLEQLNVISFVPIEPTNINPKNTTSREALKLLKQTPITGTLVINGRTYRVQRGIPDDIKNFDVPISVYSGGYSNHGRPYSYCGYTALKAGLVPGICITFDFATNTRRAFNFCQEQDLHCIKTVYKSIINKAPDAKIILHGACQGATNNLRFLAEQEELPDQEKKLKNIKAVIAESPTISVAKALQYTPLHYITLLVMRFLFPNYNPNARTIMQATRFPNNIPTLVAALPKDTISAFSDVKTMCDHLNEISTQKQGQVTLFCSNNAEIQHGQIGKAKDYQTATQKFLTAVQILRKSNLSENNV